MVIKNRCAWAKDPLNQIYHDREWGVPVYDDIVFFEFLTLEGAQAGLSWLTVLKKRENYRTAFAQFDVKKVSQFSQKKISALLKNEGLIRHRLKIESTVSNAKCFIKIQKEFGSFNNYIWQFVGGAPLIKIRKKNQQLPTSTSESDAMSLDLKKRGFKFVGTTICYAFMQACGLVIDHTSDCDKSKKLHSSLHHAVPIHRRQ